MYIIQYIVRLKEREVCPGCFSVAVSSVVVDSESSSSDSFINFLGKKVLWTLEYLKLNRNFAPASPELNLQFTVSLFLKEFHMKFNLTVEIKVSLFL